MWVSGFRETYLFVFVQLHLLLCVSFILNYIIFTILMYCLILLTYIYICIYVHTCIVFNVRIPVFHSIMLCSAVLHKYVLRYCHLVMFIYRMVQQTTGAPVQLMVSPLARPVSAGSGRRRSTRSCASGSATRRRWRGWNPGDWGVS